MQRRKFLKNTLLASGALSVASFDNISAIASKMEINQTPASGLKKSIMWGTVRLEASILDTCKAIKAAGFEGIEPNSHMNRKEVIDAMQVTGLKASSVCNSKHWNLLLSHADRSIREQGMEAMIVAMEDAKAYGTDAVLLVPGRVDENVTYDECWSRSTACIKQLIPVAQELKVKICIENVWNNFLMSPLEAREYIDQFNSPYVGFYFDCGNILAFGWPEQWIKILGYRTGRIHIKEYSRQVADKQGRYAGFNVPLTDGDVRWKEVMQQIRNEYGGGWLTTEQGSSRSLEELKDLNSRLDKILTL
ncbi:MAG: sugar phosphate isomerase/epimerase [Tannerella sp.]|jgi:hexulose-6-phosphate isomerase|nr:sugar phosphate isomerase/epimerase [Tannerella sp.]